MEVRLNNRHWFRVSLPVSYTNKVTGLCGNYDGDKTNDKMIGNLTYASASEFGNALEIVGGSNPWCRKGQPEDDDQDCDNAAEKAIYAERCAAIKSDCFMDCADAERVESLFDECVFDMCAMGGDDKIVEDYLREFAATCCSSGVQICNWRERFSFPKLTCGANARYEFSANRCPNTCVDPNAADRCSSKPKCEGCVCNDGFVQEGTRCIPRSDCGCAFQGRYYPNGASVITNDCTERCVCDGGVYTCDGFSCDDDKECRLSNSGVLGCQLKSLDQCYATGDPHYKTLDGSRYDFMGICRYVMLTTTDFTTNERGITITAQNEHRNGRTSVSYVRAVYIDVQDFQIKLGPGTAVQIYRNGTLLDVDTTFSSEDGLFSTEIIGRQAKFHTKFGISVKFNGMNLYIDVPSYYMNKVSGLCGNYTGSRDDDFGGRAIKDFAAEHLYGDGCGEGVIPDFVCSDADKAKWGGTEYCGKMTDPNGPFRFCLDSVDSKGAFDNCVFDACATEGDNINEAIEAYAQECKDRGGPLQCDWEAQIGVVPDCPAHSRYDGCASLCIDTCRDPKASDSCESTDTVQRCVCDLGYVFHEGHCVKETTCGCVIDGEYVEQGFTRMEENCAAKVTCVSSGNVQDEKNPCGEDSKCKEVESGFVCVPDEFPYALIFGAVHYKTFDNKFFDFYGTCAYLLAGYHNDDDDETMPTFNVFVKNKDMHDGKVGIDKIIVQIVRKSGEVITVTIDGDERVMIGGSRVAFGYKQDLLSVKRKRGNVALDFNFGLSVHFNGEDWVRADVNENFFGKMRGIAGNYNGDMEDDSPMDDMTPQKWGDMWRSEDYSSDDCSKTTPEVDIPCALQRRYERSCDCGIISDPTGPFRACHSKMEPLPFMLACIEDACLNDGSPWFIGSVIKAYYIACLGKGIRIEGWREVSGIEMECPMHSHYDNCTNQCQPSCSERTPVCPASACEEGCVCDDGYIMSDGDCVPEDKCGCTSDGMYYKHGYCRTNDDCDEKCTCIYGEWNCEVTSCNDQQMCNMLDGEWGCHWKDICKYDNGGCTDFCANSTCSCRPGRILAKDDHTCLDISPTFFSEDKFDSCNTTFNVWKSEFLSWKSNYLPAWKKELEAYKKYVNSGIVTMGMDECKYEWTKWYDRDDPGGCGDEETLDLLRVDHPDICEKPIAAEGRMADGRKIGAVVANFVVDEFGLVCKNSDQERGVTCPDFEVRFLCRVFMESEEGSRCG